MDSVIAVSKDSAWHTLQRRKPGPSNSRSAAQFKFNSVSRNKTRSRDDGMTSDLRSQSMQNIASLSSSYDSATVGRRPKSTAVPVSVPRVPERITRSLSHSENTLTRPTDYHGYSSDPSLLDKPSRPMRSLSVDESSRYDMRYDPPTTDLNVEHTIVATPVSATVSYLEETGPAVVARPIYDSNNNGRAANGETNRERKHSLGSNEPFNLSNALQKAVEARNERVNGLDTIDRKVSAPANITSQRRRAQTSATDRLRSDIMSQLSNTQLQAETDSYHRNDLNGGYHGNLPRRSSVDSERSSPLSSPIKKGSPKRSVKPPMQPKPAAPPPPPPTPPIAPPAPVQPTSKHTSKPVIKGKKLDMPQTAVRQGLITVDALKAKKGKLKTVQNNEENTPKSSTSIHSMVGRLAGQGGRPGAKPAPAFGGNQHVHLLARAVAARAARLANEAQENEHDSPSSWEDEASSPNIPFAQKPISTSPKKTPPPVAPKKSRSPVSGQRKPSESDNPGRRLLYPPRINDSDRSCDYSAEEDRTMMLFDDVLRKEVESENWSLNSWNSSDSSSLAEGVLPQGTCIPNSQDERQRKSSFGSGSRPWYEYSSGSPSEESLSASTERISQLRPSVPSDEGSRVNGDRLSDLRRRYSDEDGGVTSTLTRDTDINLVPVHQKHSVSNSSLGSDEVVNDSYPIDNHSPTDDSNGRYTPTNNVARDGYRDGTYSSSSDTETGVVEKTITTSTGKSVKIKLLVQANKTPTKTDTHLYEQNSPTKDNTTYDTQKTPISNHFAEGLNDFIPPPPMDFTGQDVDEISSPPLPPPPEFLPFDENDFNSPLPAPPMDFCDDDTDPGSPVDTPAINKKQTTG